MDLSKYKNKGLTGLQNTGNSCYINCCLQLLSNLYELNELLDKLNAKKIHNNEDGIMLNEWNQLRKMMWKENCTVAPLRFCKVVQFVSKKKNNELFSSFYQNDMSEFLFFIIDCFHNALKREVDMNITGKVKNSLDKLAMNCYEMMKNMYKKEYSEMLDIFYGISVTLIKSNENDDEILSNSCEPFSILTLPIPDTKSCTIYDCIELFTKEEILAGDNAWFNDKTNQRQDVKKGVKFWNLPKILILGLNRYNNSNRKLQSLVVSPLNNLDLNKYVIGYGGIENNSYELIGTANHSGNVNGGHYTANIKNLNDKWYNFNDQIINEIPEEKVVNVSTYYLFYRKKNKN